MISDKEYKRAWQGRVGSRTACLTIESFDKDSFKYLTEQYTFVCENITINNKVIVDYGCGGGLFGIHLYSWEYDPKKYIAIDIANRCVNEAKLNTLCWEQNDRNTETEVLEINPIQLFDFSLLKANIWIMLNVVRFFPDMDYVNLFFNKLNESGISKIVFNFRKGEKDIFCKKPYKTTKDISNACILTIDTIMNILNNYKIEMEKELGKSDYFLFLKKKRKSYKRIEGIK